MPPLSRDTSEEAERVFIEAQRRMTPDERLQRAVEMTELCWTAAEEAVRRAHPNAPRSEQDRIFLAAQYGPDLADRVMHYRLDQGFYD